MPRPHKNRRISCPPGAVYYKPAGVPINQLQSVTLTLDEYEAMNLLDYQGLGQEEAAVLMEISRPTVTRIYAGARKKIAQALTEGLAIQIEGGPVNENPCCYFTQEGNISGMPNQELCRRRGGIGRCHRLGELNNKKQP
ncbi:MAG: DUF134 domain-containing protein [Sedimentisphaerales bacterium]|nr:DUF134 domain-containing protein [Sedimentisphaerales bacterium]MBN2842179.1 DUF134 domain-containing protein [Sedimentisphaerales bacterium]